jgi:hypothetical protein
MRDRLNACSKGLLEFQGEIFILRGVVEEKTLESCVRYLESGGWKVRAISKCLAD